MDTEANHEFRLKQTNKPVIGALQSSATEFTNTVCNARYKRVVHSELELDDAVSSCALPPRCCTHSGSGGGLSPSSYGSAATVGHSGGHVLVQ